VADVGVDVGGEGGAEGVATAGGEGAEREPVVAAVEGEDAGPARGEQRGLECHLDRIGARGGEVDGGVRQRRTGDERGGEGDARRVRGDVAEAVEEAPGLPPHRRDDRRVAVADERHAEPRGQVDVAVAVDVEDVGAARLTPRRGAASGVDARRFEGAEIRCELAGARAGRRHPEARQEIAAGERRRLATAPARATERRHGRYISRRPSSERESVTSSVYSMSPPTGMPKARRVTRTPRGLSSRAR